ncbi:MAG: hypothetical protein AAF607_11960, partial [Pseudomonadota bacterium]
MRAAMCAFGAIALDSCTDTAGPSQEKPGPAAQLIDCDGCPEMILISAGDFIMGRDDGEPKRYDGPP